MTVWIRIITLVTQGTQIWTIITLARSTIQRAKNDPRQTLQLNCNENYKPWISESVLVCSMKRIRTLSGKPRIVLWNWYAENLHNLSSAQQSFRNNYWALQMENYKIWHLRILEIGSSSHCPIISSDGIRSTSGTIPENPPNFDSVYNTEYTQIFLVFWG